MTLDSEKKPGGDKNADGAKDDKGQRPSKWKKRRRSRKPRQERNASDGDNDKNMSHQGESAKPEVEEKTLGPGRKRRIFKRKSKESGSSEGKQNEDGPREGRRERKRPAKEKKRRNPNKQRRTEGQEGSEEARGDRRGNRNNRGNRRSNQDRRRSGRSREENKRPQEGFRPAPDAPDGAFSADTSPRFSPAGNYKQKKDQDIAVSGDVEYFSAKKGFDFSSMKESEIEFLKPHVVDENEFYDNMPVLDTDKPVRGRLMDVVGIKTHRSGSIDPFDCENTILTKGEEVIIETERGMAIGTVVIPTTRRYMEMKDIKKTYRVATVNDVRQKDRNLQKISEAFSLCQRRISELRLVMKLVEVTYLHSGNKAVFYFMAEGRVDFRQLVKELARELHVRVEMRQIGVRDASKMIGGIGTCGHHLCCSRYLREFHPVSIRMAKDQDLVLNPEKVSGQCGRLMCCLAYEEKVYKEKSKQMPKVGKFVETPEGCGRVRDRNILKGELRVQIDGEHGFMNFNVSDVKKITKNDMDARRQASGAGDRNDTRPQSGGDRSRDDRRHGQRRRGRPGGKADKQVKPAQERTSVQTDQGAAQSDQTTENNTEKNTEQTSNE